MLYRLNNNNNNTYKHINALPRNFMNNSSHFSGKQYLSLFTTLNLRALVIFVILMVVCFILPTALILGLISLVLTYAFNISSSALWYILPGVLASLFAAQWYFFSRINKKAQAAITKAHNALLDPLNIKGDEQILDIGCGMGLLVRDAAKRLTTGKAIGLDISEKALQIARASKAIDTVAYVSGDARALPFDNDSFDIIVSNLAIHCIGDQKERLQALSEITRVLKPGGTVTIADTGSFIKEEYEAFFKDHGFTAITLSEPYYHSVSNWRILKATK